MRAGSKARCGRIAEHVLRCNRLAFNPSMFSGAASFNRLGRLVVWCCQLRLVPNLCRVVLVEGGCNDERVEVGRTVEHGTRGSAVARRV